MVCWLIRGAINLARPVEYAVQAGRSFFVSFEWLLPLTGFGATESGVDRRILCIIIVASTLMFVASGPSVLVSSFGSAWVAGTVAAVG